MTYRGAVRRGVVVLETGAQLAEGMIVRVEPVSPAHEPATAAEEIDPVFRMGELATQTGIIDLATEADHYLSL